MAFKQILIVAVTMAFVVGGCGKKQEPEIAESEFSQSSGFTDETMSEDTSDIFDEFYDDEGTETTLEDETMIEEAQPPEPPAYTPEFQVDGKFVVQVSCVASEAIANDNVAQLEARGYPAYVAEVQNPTPELIGTYYRIRIGSFYGVSKAKEFAESILVPGGYDYWVDNKSNDNVGIDAYGLGDEAPVDYGTGTDDSYSTESSSTTDDWGTSSDAGTESTDDWGTSSESSSTDSWDSNAGSSTTEPSTTDTDAGTDSETTTESSEWDESGSGAESSTEDAGSGDDWGDDDWGSDSDW